MLDENYQDGTPGSSRRAEADEDERSEEEADEDQAVQTAREEESEEEEEESPALSQPSTPRDDEKPRPKWMDQRLQSAKKADQQMEPACQTRQQVHHEQRQRNISGQRDYNSQLTYRKEQEMMMQPQQQPQVQTYGERDRSKNPLRLRLDLNLEVEIELKAHIHGDLTLALLYAVLFSFAHIVDAPTILSGPASGNNGFACV